MQALECPAAIATYAAFGQGPQRLRWSPDLDFGDDPELVAEFQELAIAFRQPRQRDGRLAGRAGRGRGDPLAADLLEQVHRPLRRFHPFPPPCRVVDRPFEEIDRAFHLNAGVAEPLAEVRKRAACVLVPVQLVDPGLHALVTRLGGDVDDLDDRQLLASDGAGVQADRERPRPAPAPPSFVLAALEAPVDAATAAAPQPASAPLRFNTGPAARPSPFLLISPNPNSGSRSMSV